MNRSRFPRRYVMLCGIALLVVAALCFQSTGRLVLPASDAVQALSLPSVSSPEHELQAAWRRAQEAGAYHFATEIVQTTYPAPTLSNVGRSSRQETIYLEGQTDLFSHELFMTLWQGGNLLNQRDGVEVRVEDEQAYGRTIGGTWQEMDNFSDAFAPADDLTPRRWGRYSSGGSSTPVAAQPPCRPSTTKQ